MASRGKRWSRAETLFLITTLDEMDIMTRLDGRKHNNTDLFKAVVSKMIEEGFTQRDDSQIRNKWKLLKQEYNKAKAHDNKSRSDLSTFEFYEEVDRLLGKRPLANADNHDVELGCNDSQIPNNPLSGFLPLSSLRLLVPPVQLLSAALWQIVKEGAVVYYDLLEEFVSTVLETVPELLTDTEAVQLVMGLRAKVVLELCRSDDFATPESIQPHLSSIKAYIAKQDTQTSGFEVKASMTNFLKLVNALVDDQHQRDVFYEKIFPMVFGKKYDSALQALLRKFLLNLQRLLPVPSLEQTSLWLSLSPPVLKECVDFVSQPEHLTTLIQHQKNHGHEVPQDLPSAGDDCILSSLSYRLAKVDNDEGSTAVASGSDWHIENSLGSASGENFEEIDSEVAMIGERNGQQHTDDLSEHQGASVEVILQPFDESDDEDSKKWFQHLKTHNRTSAITFECFACGQEFCSLGKLKRHKMTHRGCLMHKLGQADSARRRNVLKKTNLHPKPKSSVEDTASEDELSTHDPSNPNSPPNSEQSNDHYRVACHGCGKVFTYPKNSDTQDPPCSTSSAHRSEPNPVALTKEPSSSEAEPLSLAPQDLIPSDSCKRSSRIKTCSICGETFTCSADLTSHMRTHFDQNPYFCSNCEKDFDSSEDWDTHQEGEFRNQQQENSSSGTNVKNHQNSAQIQTVVDVTADSQACKSPFTCQECGRAFTFYKSFEEHQSMCCERTPQRINRTNSNRFIISACNFQSAGTSSETAESETVAPRNSLNTSDIIKCTMCEKNFSDIAQMRSHYSQSHEVTGPYPCPLCKRAFVRLSELVQHQQNKKLYQCATCKKCYANPGQLNDHEKVHTAGVTPRACETCGKSFKARSYLLRHQRKHRERQPCVCSYCGKQFGTMVCLRAHMVRHMGGYPCQLCGKKFNQKTYLKWHMDRHMGQEPYLCDTCGKGWPSAAQLKLHMVQHSEDRPFQCEDCGASYKRASHLKAHRQSKHIRLRPFVCNVCGKTYRLNCELKRHMMVHTGERLFACPRCGKTFMQKSSLREHRERACL